MNDGLLRTDKRIVGSFDEFVARLGKHLNCDVIGNVPVFNEQANEVKVGLARRRKPNFDLFVTHVHQQLEHL